MPNTAAFEAACKDMDAKMSSAVTRLKKANARAVDSALAIARSARAAAEPTDDVVFDLTAKYTALR